MKRTVSITIALAASLIALASSAGAADRQSLGTVSVNGTTIDCTPPNSAKVCAEWHDEIRRNFSSREIGMLFGSATAYPESLTSYSRVKERYQQLQGSFAASHLSLDNIAAK